MFRDYILSLYEREEGGVLGAVNPPTPFPPGARGNKEEKRGKGEYIISSFFSAKLFTSLISALMRSVGPPPASPLFSVITVIIIYVTVYE